MIKTYDRISFDKRLKSQYINDETVENYPDMFFICCLSSGDHGINFEPSFKNPHPNVITETFDDITNLYPRDGYEGRREKMVLFSPDQAARIVKFVNNIKLTSNVLIHCSAGISRSGAIGFYIATRLGMVGDYLEANKQVSPNKYVLKLLWEKCNEINGTSYRDGDVNQITRNRVR
jgi:hypothetical protein